MLRIVKAHRTWPIDIALRHAQRIREAMAPVCGKVEVCGSIRRQKDWVSDIDIICTTKEKSEKVWESFDRFMDNVDASGRCMLRGKMKAGIRIQVAIVEEEGWGAALCHATGGQETNIVMRSRAIAQGQKLNQYGIWQGSRRVAGLTEREVFETLNMAWKEPQERG